jgi:magnesium transporter
MISYYFSDSEDQKVVQHDKIHIDGWIRAERPSDDEMDLLVGLGIDADILTDALDPHEVPRIEYDDGWTYLITRVPDVGDDFNDFTTPVMFAVGRSQIVTISRDPLGRLWQGFIDNGGVVTTERTRFFIAAIEMIIRSYQTRVATINRQMRAATSDIRTLRPRDIATFVEYERKLNDYLDALIPTNTAVEKTLSGRLLKLREDDKDLVEDLSVDLEQVIARCKSLLRTITNVRDSYRAVMDTKLNETMRILTVATLALTIPTMLAGIFGMNVDFPFNPHAPLVFWAIIMTSIFCAALVVYYFVRKRQ